MDTALNEHLDEIQQIIAQMLREDGACSATTVVTHVVSHGYRREQVSLALVEGVNYGRFGCDSRRMLTLVGQG